MPKTTYPKINIYQHGKGYLCSTTWAATCKEAVKNYREKHPDLAPGSVYAFFAHE